VSNAPEEPPGYKKYIPGGEKPMEQDARRRLIMTGCIVFVILIFLVPAIFGHGKVKSLSYSQLLKDASHHQVKTADVNSNSGVITGKLSNGVKYSTNGPITVIGSDITKLRTTDGVKVTFSNP
jgi:ATP-dependent Zn protease